MCKDATKRSLDYFNGHKVLCVYVDITVLIWKKVNEVFSSQNFPVKSYNSNTKIGYERCLMFFKKTLAGWKSIVVVHLKPHQL